MSRNRDTSTASPFILRNNMPVALKVSSKADTVVQLREQPDGGLIN